MRKLIPIRLLVAVFVMYSFSLNSLRAQADTTDFSVFDMDIEALMNIPIVSASKKAESSFDSPLSASIITKDEIEKSGATTIEELMRMVPGFIVRETTNGNFDVHIRGNDNAPPGSYIYNATNQMTLIMIDGRKVYNQMNGGTLWETLPVSLTDIESIEIIRGPSAALYGPNAVTGVINIITKKSLTNQHEVHANLQGGTSSTFIANASVGYKVNKLSLRISGNVDNRDREQNTYYNYARQEYVIADSLVDYTGSGNNIPASQVEGKYGNPYLAKRKMGGNLFARYDLSEKSYIDLAYGIQSSEAQVPFMEGTTTPITKRESMTQSVDVRAQTGNLLSQVSLLTGTQDIYVGARGIIAKYDLTTIDGNIEYDYSKNNLTIRPGINYQFASYNDSPYISEEDAGKGILNGTKELSSLGVTLRGDYTLQEKLRLIAALRMDKYQYPDDTYFTYQFIGTYKLNENHIVRALTSRANRGAFMADIHSNIATGSNVYEGTQDINLPVMTSYEVGTRNKITDFLQTDVELFYNKTTNFSGLEFDNVDLGTGTVTLKYRNYPTELTQLGATITVNMAPSKNLLIKAFATVQNSQMKDYEQDKYINPFPGVFLPSSDTISGNTEHKNTPRIFGGATINYNYKSKLNVFATLYGYGEQTYSYEYVPVYENGNPEDKITPKLRLDMKVSYNIWRQSSVFVNARNLLNASSNEFGFADNIGGLYLAGLDLKF